MTQDSEELRVERDNVALELIDNLRDLAERDQSPGDRRRNTLRDAANFIETRHRLQSQTVVAGDGQDRKFAFRDGQFVNRVSGETIPTDEPIIIFRARDRHALGVLRAYLTMVEDEHHQQAIRDRIGEFEGYAERNPERIKEPGTTRHIALNATPPSPHPIAPASEDTAGAVERAREAWSVMMRQFGHAFGNIDDGYYPEVEEMRAALVALPASEHGRDYVLIPRAAAVAGRRALNERFDIHGDHIAAIDAALQPQSGEAGA